MEGSDEEASALDQREAEEDEDEDEAAEVEREGPTNGQSSPAGPFRINAQDWEERKAVVEVPHSLLNRVVMNYLIAEGYEKGAACFARETGMDPGVDLSSVAARVRIKDSVVRGDLDSAIHEIRHMNPELFKSRADLLFALKRQKTIELIRRGDFLSAIAYARRELAPLVESNSELRPALEEAMACLLLFENVHTKDCGARPWNEQRHRQGERKAGAGGGGGRA